jgi:hypothetical protein
MRARRGRTVGGAGAAENEEAAHLIPAVGGPPPASEEEWVPAVGDVSILRDDLYALDPATNGPTGDQLGTNTIHCTVVHADLEAFALDLLCRGVITLPRGTMTWEGKVAFSDEAERAFAVAITGGTGLYADAGGRAIINESDDEESGDTIYEVRLLHLALQP